MLQVETEEEEEHPEELEEHPEEHLEELQEAEEVLFPEADQDLLEMHQEDIPIPEEECLNQELQEEHSEGWETLSL